MLPVLNRALEPASVETLAAVLASETPSFGINARDKSDEEWAIFWRPYLSTLGAYSLASVQAAFAIWHTCPDGLPAREKAARRFYPQPVDLDEFARAHRNRLSMMRHRVTKALEHREAPPPKVIDRLSKADMIAKGWMTPDGKMILGTPKAMPTAFPTSRSPQQVADDLRAHDARARAGGAPINAAHIHPDDDGEAI